MEDPPPPYSTSSLPSSLPSEPGHHATHNPLKQFRRYVIEIMAFTFDADFSLLNRALGQPPISPDSILTSSERANLLDLATLMQDLEAKILGSGRLGGTQFFAIRTQDREAVADAVIRPALYLGLRAGYMLEIISAYATHQCNPSKRSFSFIERKKPYLYSFWRSLEFLGPFNFVLGIFTNDLWACAKVIEAVAEQEEVRIILANAMDGYQKHVLGIPYMYHIERWSENETWIGLQGLLISENEDGGIRSERRDRERAIAKKMVKRVTLGYSANI
jgi:hypothetical protein